jgi:hypothetical protein
MDGIYNINKAVGMTSHDVVARVRRLAKQKRVGHSGTLDPAASGVLPVCLGQATRVAEYLSESGRPIAPPYALASSPTPDARDKKDVLGGQAQLLRCKLECSQDAKISTPGTPIGFDHPLIGLQR